MSQALINLLIALALLGGESMTGYAPRYDPGGMEHVADIRGLPHVPCMVSSAYYDVGVWVYVRGVNTGVLRYCRVTDVSDPTRVNGRESDRDRHRRTRRIVELSYEMAIELCGRKNINGPSRDCPIEVYRVNEP